MATARPAINPLANPYFLLTMTTIFWAGNTIAGRLAIGNVPPMALTAVRWFLAFAMLAAFYPDVARRAPQMLREKPLYVIIMGIIGFTGFNAIYYIAAHHTFAVNLGIMQASTPIFVMLGASLFQGARITAGQIAGLVAGLIGVLIVASTGKLSVLMNLDFNRGDLMVLGVSAIYAAYSLGLRYKPKDWEGLQLFAAMALVAAVTSLPLLAAEAAMGKFFWPTLQGWGVIAFVSVFPSLLAQIWYIKGIAMVGAARAGFLFNAIPVFAAVMSVAILGEPFGWYHAVGLALVIGGIAWAEKHKS
jgi:drug/metabolite transporter (DMT)-like permease